MLNRLKIWQKLGLIGLAFMIPLSLTTYFLLDEKSIKIDFATAEMQGNQYLRPVHALFVDLLKHRSLALRQLGAGTDPSVADDLARTASAIDEDFRSLDETDRSLGPALRVSVEELSKRQRADSLPRAMEQKWRDLKNAPDPASSVEQYSRLVTDVRNLITHVGDCSKLILDPDLDTYYVMDALLLREPEIVQQISVVADTVEQMARRRASTLDERLAVAKTLSHLLANVDGLQADIDAAFLEQERFSGYRALRLQLSRPLANARDAIRTFARMTEEGAVRAPTVAVDVPRYLAAAAQSLNANFELWTKLLDQEDAMLQIRMGSDLHRKSFALWSVLLAVIGAAILTLFIMQSITRPIRKAVDVAAMLAKGELPETIETGNSMDEAVVLLRAVNDMLQFLDLRRTITVLQQSADTLTGAAADLENQTAEQNEAVTHQASALRETQATAQEIKQTSQVAAQKAEAVIQMAQRADEVSRAGESAIEQSLDGLTNIRAQAESIAEKISELNEHTLQIGGITQTVKDLADQSNMLALNAAVEAVRSGEHGKGFAVVAREIRSLADQSIRATGRVKDILDNIGSATRMAVAITETGKRRMEAGLVQVKASGENLRELSGIVKDNSQGVRQIAAAVSQQNAGISQIFSAVTDQTQMMNNTIRSLEATKQAAAVVKQVSQQIAGVVKRYRI